MTGELLGQVDAYIAALMPSPQAQVLARVTAAADNAAAIGPPGGELTDGDQAAATVITDGSAQYVLVCVPVTEAMAGEAARRRAEGVSARVQVTVDLTAEAVP